MKKLGSSGFAALEAVLIVVIVGIVGFTGWYVWHSKQATDSTLAQTGNSKSATITKKTTTKTAASTEVSATWTAYTTKNRGMSFKYPSNWTINDESDSTDDQVLLTAPSGFVLTFATVSIGHPSADTPQTVLFTQPISNKSLSDTRTYMDYIAGTGTDSKNVKGFILSQSTTDPFDVIDNTDGVFDLYVHGETKNPESVTAAKADADYAAAATLATTIAYGS